MKKFTFVAALFLVSGHVFAVASAEEVLSVQTLKVGEGIEVALPTVKLADGSICQSYVSDVAREAESGKFDVKVSRVCGMEARVSNGVGGFDVRPANLLAMRTFTSNGLTVQLPDTKVSTGT